MVKINANTASLLDYNDKYGDIDNYFENSKSLFIMSSKHPEFCSTREAASLLGVSLRTAQLWVESGVLRAWKTAGGHRRILKSSIDAILRERERAVEGATKAGGFRILVVEDDPDLLKLYRLHIAGWGLPVTLASNQSIDHSASEYPGKLWMASMRIVWMILQASDIK